MLHQDLINDLIIKQCLELDASCFHKISVLSSKTAPKNLAGALVSCFKTFGGLVIPIITPSLPIHNDILNNETRGAIEPYPMLNVDKKLAPKLLPENIYPLSTENRRIAIELGLLA